MALEPEMLLQDVRRLAVKLGDVLVVKYPHRLGKEQVVDIRTAMERVFPHNKTLILDQGLDIDVISPEESI